MKKHAPRGPRIPARPGLPAPASYDLDGRDLEDRPARFPDHWPNDDLVVSTAVDADEWPAWTDHGAWTLAPKGGVHVG